MLKISYEAGTQQRSTYVLLEDVDTVRKDMLRANLLSILFWQEIISSKVLYKGMTKTLDTVLIRLCSKLKILLEYLHLKSLGGKWLNLQQDLIWITVQKHSKINWHFLSRRIWRRVELICYSRQLVLQWMFSLLYPEIIRNLFLKMFLPKKKWMEVEVKMCNSKLHRYNLEHSESIFKVFVF